MAFAIRTTLAAALLAPSVIWAAGSDSSEPPTPTSTTQTCTEGLIWDAETSSCVAPKDARLDDDMRYGAVREFTYAGQLENALTVLEAMADQDADRVLTYRGFIARKQGHWGQALSYYDAALTRNPDNLLARSYYGQGLAQAGAKTAAQVQLAEIRQRGGAGSWAERALLTTLQGGVRQDY